MQLYNIIIAVLEMQGIVCFTVRESIAEVIYNA